MQRTLEIVIVPKWRNISAIHGCNSSRTARLQKITVHRDDRANGGTYQKVTIHGTDVVVTIPIMKPLLESGQNVYNFNDTRVSL
jgi:hypothetical protein